jgi:hypothetical protein
MLNPENPVILFRKGFDSDGEAAAASAHLPVVGLRSAVPPNSLVVGRYACLPYYGELVADLAHKGSRLINSHEQHSYIANFDYYEDIREHTFPTWFACSDVPTSHRWGRAFVVKGRTNSRKLQWSTHMHATDWPSAVKLSAELANDPLIGPQGLIVREYVPLETLEIGINRMPITNEWRLFFYKDTLLASGYYWAIIDDESKVDAARPDFEARGIPFAKMIAGILAERANFFVIDIARTAAGEWKVVEVNDGQQSGLNHFVQASELYANLAAALVQEAQISEAFRAMNVCGTTTGRISSKDQHRSASPSAERALDNVVSVVATWMSAKPFRCKKCGEMSFRHPYRNCDEAE